MLRKFLAKMRNVDAYVSLLNMAIRGLSMVAKFALAIYMAKYFAIDNVGQYGLLQGIVGAAPAVLGFGINYFMSRALVGNSAVDAMSIVRDRLLITISASLLIAVSFWIFGRNYFGANISFAVIFFLTLTECLALDIFQALVGLGQSFLANCLLFLRTAFWVFPVVGFGIAWPMARSLDILVLAWACGNALSLFVAVWFFRSYITRAVVRRKIDFSWLKGSRLSWILIYVSDIAIVWQLYADRFIIKFFRGDADVGRYTLYYALLGSISMLIGAGLIQPKLPAFVMAYRAGRAEWIAIVVANFKTVMAGFVSVGFFVGFLAFAVLPGIFGVKSFLNDWFVVSVFFLAMLMKTINDYAMLCLYSLSNDRSLSLWSIGGMVLGALVTCLCAYFGDLLLICMGLVVTGALLAAGRILAIQRSVLRLGHEST